MIISTAGLQQRSYAMVGRQVASLVYIKIWVVKHVEMHSALVQIIYITFSLHQSVACPGS